jgi:hypothetical protein
MPAVFSFFADDLEHARREVEFALDLSRGDTITALRRMGTVPAAYIAGLPAKDRKRARDLFIKLFDTQVEAFAGAPAARGKSAKP